MKRLHAISELSELPGPLCVAIGVFDGVHLGHRALIERTLAEARQKGGSAAALTFHPHPARVLRPDSAPRLLTSTPHKLRLMEALGCPAVLVVEFDDAFAALTPREFIHRISSAAKPLGVVAVGHNWAFGHARSGNVALLRKLGADQGFETVEIDPVMADGELVSSTRIRRAVEEGDFAAAGTLLGRDYTILGTVGPGAHVGHQLGFPTANLSAHNEQFPPNGVYAVQALLRGSWLGGVANVGIRPTVTGSHDRILEVHVFDFEGECYGEDMEVLFVRRIRDERKFPSLEALRDQICSDVSEARLLLSQ